MKGVIDRLTHADPWPHLVRHTTSGVFAASCKMICATDEPNPRSFMLRDHRLCVAEGSSEERARNMQARCSALHINLRALFSSSAHFMISAQQVSFYQKILDLIDSKQNQSIKNMRI